MSETKGNPMTGEQLDVWIKFFDDDRNFMQPRARSGGKELIAEVKRVAREAVEAERTLIADFFENKFNDCILCGTGCSCERGNVLMKAVKFIRSRSPQPTTKGKS